MLDSRALIVFFAFVTLIGGGAPWRVCSHAHEGHGRVWLPDLAHLQEGHAHGHSHGHGHAPCEHGPCCPDHPGCPEEPGEGHCHCDDQALVTGMPFALVALDAPALAEWTVPCVAFACELGVPEVAPSEPDRGRVACEEDSIVLLR